MTVRNVKKNLAGQQDLLPGVGPYTQTRRGETVVMHGPARSYFDLFVRSYAEVGLPVKGTFEDGCTLVTVDDIAIHLAEGLGYSYSGTLPRVIVAGENPNSNPLWTVRSADSFRELIAGPQGSSHVGFQQAGTGSVPRTSQDKMRERITPMDFGAVGDGVTNDDAAFSALEATFSGREVDLLGLVYAVSVAPIGDKYVNGSFALPGGIFQSAYRGEIRCWDRPIEASGAGPGGIAIGTNAAANIPDHSAGNPSKSFIAIGRDALANGVRGRSCIAIGQNTLSKNSPGFANLAIGDFALTHVAGVSSSASQMIGSRNIGLGTLAGHFITSGSINVLIGRNAGHCITTGNSNTAIGYRALTGGYSPVGLSGAIENQTPVTANGRSAVGNGALQYSSGELDTAIGEFAGRNLKKGGSNTMLGGNAGMSLDLDLSENGKIVTRPNIAGTYTQAGTTLTITAPASGVVSGNKVGFSFTSGENSVITTDMQWLTVASVIDANSFTITTPSLPAASGAVVIGIVETAVTRVAASTNTIVGVGAMQNSKTAQGAAVLGWQAGLQAEGSANTLLGQRAGYNLTTGATNTFVGFNSGRTNPVGGGILTFSNSATLGANAGVSGDNQVQLGDSATTTYVYGTVQNRSDIRDKTDIQDTKLGIDFIMGLRPVDGRWDMRDDYWEEYDEQVGVDAEGWPVFETKRRQIPKDGSRARQRKHHWFIAQEVKELSDSLGVEFGGYQDHNINGGCDVLSLGYDEFIPPMTKAIQQCWLRMDEMERRLKALEGGA